MKAIFGVLILAGCGNLLGLHDITPDGEPVGLAILQRPSGLTGQPLEALRVQVVDVAGKPTPGFAGEVRLTLGANPAGGALIGGLTAVPQGSTAVFDAIGLSRAGTGYTLTASADGLASATSAPFDVSDPRFEPVVTGLPGSEIASVAVTTVAGSSVAFAGAKDRIYRSVDRGGTWMPASFGGAASGLVTADPQHPGTLYLRDPSRGALKKSTDGGSSWHLVDGVTFVEAFAIDPRDSAILYAVSGDATLQRSADGGATWTAVETHLPCRSLAIDVTAIGTFYCTRYDQNTGTSLGLARSSDGGTSWKAVPGFSVSNLVVATPTAVFASADDKLYRSTDHGASWSVVVAAHVAALVAAPSAPDRIYFANGGVAVSRDGGQTFGATVTMNDAVTYLAVDPADPDLVYAAGQHGVYVSRNGGTSWSPASNGIDAHAFSSLAIAPDAPSTVLTSYDNTALRSTDGGATWGSTTAPSANYFFDPDVHTRVWRCGRNVFARSEDSGATFTTVTQSGLDTYCSRLLFAGTSFYTLSGNNQLLRSTNRGATWTAIPLSPTVAVVDAAIADPAGNAIVLATPNGLYRSSNGGDSFTQVTSDPSFRVVATPELATRIISGECRGFRISTDLGATFGEKITDLCVQQLTSSGGTLWAAGVTNRPMTGAQVTQLARSTDGGASWATVEITGLPDRIYIAGLAASEDGRTVYLATQAGLYKGAFD